MSKFKWGMKGCGIFLLWAAAALLLTVLASTACAQNTRRETVVHSFRGGTDGQWSDAQLIRDASGNLYGTTEYGGVPTCGQNIGCGTVFKVSPSGKETVLYAFTSGTDGSNPTGGVVRDAVGNLYGVASEEADHNGGAYGSVFRLEPSGKLITLYTFTGGTDGGLPLARVIRDSTGNLYGTTAFGGVAGGTVFKVDRSGHETVLYSFMGGSDGLEPFAPVFRDQAGNLYGTTNSGGGACGGNNGGCGTVFKIDSSGNETVLYRFTNGLDGGYPYAGLIQDPGGNLYGTAPFGGDTSCNVQQGCGVVFKIDTSGNYTVLHTFTGGTTDGANPFGALTLDAAENLYGTTAAGGDVNCSELSGFSGCGTVFKLDPLGKETLLHIFGESAGDGLVPFAGVFRDEAGKIYGSTSLGGKHTLGTVYKISPK
jgi:uncharacterized repeat protein (TIGR03803 family)